MRHTPGPWFVTDDAAENQPDKLFVTVKQDGFDYDICEIVNDHHDNPKANANLIAAAPDMYIALEYLREVIIREQLGEHFRYSKLAHLFTTLAKARGEA